MSKKDRLGKPQTREQRVTRRVPEMGYYLIVTDTSATEKCYFEGLRDSLPEDMQSKLVIRVVQTDTKNLVEKCRELSAYDAQYRAPWIVFDRDRVRDFDAIIQEAENNGIHVGWSNPCFEIWMFGYFENIPTILESWTCCRKFGETYQKHTGQEYSKSDKDLYRRLNVHGDEQKALKRAEMKYKFCIEDGKTKPSEMVSCTTVQKLVSEIKMKAYNR